MHCFVPHIRVKAFPLREIVVFVTLNFRKDLDSFWLAIVVNFANLEISSFFLTICSFLYSFFIRFSMNRSSSQSVLWWSVWVDSNHRPRAYQARALTTWATDRYCSGSLSDPRLPGEPFDSLLVEMMGIEPMTPCLQGRCSPSWATPPGFFCRASACGVTENWTTVSNKDNRFMRQSSFIKST